MEEAGKPWTEMMTHDCSQLVVGAHGAEGSYPQMQMWGGGAVKWLHQAASHWGIKDAQIEKDWATQLDL